MTNSSGVRTPRDKKALDLRVGVAHSRADLRLDRREGMIGTKYLLVLIGRELRMHGAVINYIQFDAMELEIGRILCPPSAMH